jgi:hypothetical protein
MLTGSNPALPPFTPRLIKGITRRSLHKIDGEDLAEVTHLTLEFFRSVPVDSP